MPSSFATRCARSVGLLICGLSIATAWPASAQTTTPATYAYSVALTVAFPAGSAGTSLLKTQPTATKFTPCNSAANLDQVTFTLKYDAGKTAAEKKDVFLLFHRPEATGTAANPKFFTVTKWEGANEYPSVRVRPDLVALNLNKRDDVYVRAANNLGGAITETILGGNIVLEQLWLGTWQVVAILGSADTIDFANPDTWVAWDIGTFILNRPWTGSTTGYCQ